MSKKETPQPHLPLNLRSQVPSATPSYLAHARTMLCCLRVILAQVLDVTSIWVITYGSYWK